MTVGRHHRTLQCSDGQLCPLAQTPRLLHVAHRDPRENGQSEVSVDAQRVLVQCPLDPQANVHPDIAPATTLQQQQDVTVIAASVVVCCCSITVLHRFRSAHLA